MPKIDDEEKHKTNAIQVPNFVAPTEKKKGSNQRSKNEKSSFSNDNNNNNNNNRGGQKTANSNLKNQSDPTKAQMKPISTKSPERDKGWESNTAPAPLVVPISAEKPSAKSSIWICLICEHDENTPADKVCQVCLMDRE